MFQLAWLLDGGPGMAQCELAVCAAGAPIMQANQHRHPLFPSPLCKSYLLGMGSATVHVAYSSDKETQVALLDTFVR
jgi:hypothetical protein